MLVVIDKQDMQAHCTCLYLLSTHPNLALSVIIEVDEQSLLCCLCFVAPSDARRRKHQSEEEEKQEEEEEQEEVFTRENRGGSA